jgi:hypothetical protein
MLVEGTVKDVAGFNSMESVGPEEAPILSEVVGEDDNAAATATAYSHNTNHTITQLATDCMQRNHS